MTSGALGRPNRVEGAKRLRRSRWECGPRMRGAREGIRPEAWCGWAPHESGRPRSTGVPLRSTRKCFIAAG